MTRREVHNLIQSALDVCLESPDMTKERHPEIRWRDTDRVARNDTAAMLQDICATLRGDIEIPAYCERYGIMRRKD